jgi:hypothetical protein
VVFVAGCEMTAFCGGFLPGDTYMDRLQAMVIADLQWWMSLGPVLERFNAYRTAQNAGTFRAHLREYFPHGKPVAVTEYGTCAYRGAGDLGGMAWQPPPSPAPATSLPTALCACSTRPGGSRRRSSTRWRPDTRASGSLHR